MNEGKLSHKDKNTVIFRIKIKQIMSHYLNLSLPNKGKYKTQEPKSV